jgi:hypothetical protein
MLDYLIMCMYCIGSLFNMSVLGPSYFLVVLCILVAVPYYSGPLVPFHNVFFVCMSRMKMVFEINYGGRFDKKYGCIYMGGQVDVHPDNVDLDNMSFVLIEFIVGQYGYSPGDLIYFRDPTKNLVDGLQLVSLDYDVAYMAAKHVDTPILGLYIVSFQNDGGGDGEDWENDEEGDDGGRLILMIHGWMIKSVMMTMFLKRIIWWIVLAPQQCQKLIRVWRVMGRMGIGMVMMVLRVRVGVVWVMVMAKVGPLV